jgi:hypothetical protein
MIISASKVKQNNCIPTRFNFLLLVYAYGFLIVINGIAKTVIISINGLQAIEGRGGAHVALLQLLLDFEAFKVILKIAIHFSNVIEGLSSFDARFPTLCLLDMQAFKIAFQREGEVALIAIG